MIDLYTWATPNGHKIAIMLEEIGAPYKVVPVNIIAGDQLKSDFLKLNPNNKIPVIVDHEAPGGKPVTVFESGAILLYLAEKSGKLLPKDVTGRFAALEWLFFQVGGVGPMLGQAHYFRKYAVEQVKHAIDRYTNEANRLYRVLNGQLGRGSLSRGRLFDRRHRLLSLGALARDAGPGSERVPQRQALVRSDRRAPRRAEGPDRPRRQGAEPPARKGRGSGAVGRPSAPAALSRYSMPFNNPLKNACAPRRRFHME